MSSILSTSTNHCQSLPKAVVLSLVDTRDWFCGRQLSHGPRRRGDSFGVIQEHYTYCELYFCYYYISPTSDHQALDHQGWGPLSHSLLSMILNSQPTPHPILILIYQGSRQVRISDVCSRCGKRWVMSIYHFCDRKYWCGIFSYDQSSFLKPLNDFCIWLRGLNSPLSMLQSYDIEKKKKSFEISG